MCIPLRSSVPTCLVLEAPSPSRAPRSVCHASVVRLTCMGNSDMKPGESADSAKSTSPSDPSGADGVDVLEQGESFLFALAGEDGGHQRNGGLRDGTSRTQKGDVIDATVGEFRTRWWSALPREG